MRVVEQSHKAIGIVYTSMEHAPYVEFGTGQRGKGSYPYERGLTLAYDPNWPGQVAQPFMVPALLTNRIRINKLIAAAAVSGVQGGK